MLGAEAAGWVVVFSKGTERMSHVTYNFDLAGSSHHLVCDLDSNQTFQIKQNGTLIQTEQTGADGTLFFAVQNSGGEASISIEKAPSAVSEKTTRSARFQLRPNYPNPFNAGTLISFTVPRTCFVTIRIVNVLGEEVGLLLNETKKAGTYRVRFSGENLPSGVYFCHLRAGKYSEVRKILLQK